ncbi:hypothetical protein APHAL10511_008646, partial [Amanita phalloides]
MSPGMDTPASLGKRKHDDSVISARKLPRRDDSQTRHHVIAFYPSILDKINKLSYGVQYTLAHLISTGQLDYASLNTTMLQNMQGPNTQANGEALAKLIKGHTSASPSMMEQMFVQELAANSPWEELDKEEEALAKDFYAGLGSHPDYPGWYGGRVAFRGRITKNECDGYKIHLERGSLGSSCRFTRRFGSKCFIRIKIPPSIFYSQHNQLITFFKQRFVLWGHVFQACYAKDDNVFLLKVNEMMLVNGSIEKTGGFSLEDFVEWFNPLESNKKQPLSKWAARFSLGFSNSVPGPQISPENILHEDDICDLDKIPMAIQFRLGGCKGMLVLRETGSDSSSKDGFKVWIRPSQTKIKGQLADPGH